MKYGKSVFFIVWLSVVSGLMAQEIRERREYTPVILKGERLSIFSGVPVDSLRLYAWDGAAWSVMPFQIDEMAKAIDPFRLPDSVWRWSPFFPDDGLLDGDDELVFMIRDMGEQAPAACWIDDAASQGFERMEIAVSPPQNPADAAYAYLYRVPVSPESIPRPYDLSYTPETATVQSAAYTVALDDSSGLVQDIAIHAPYGNGSDIFDTQKLRFIGLMDLAGVTLPIGREAGVNSANERDNLHIFPPEDIEHHYHEYTRDPVVRVIREVRQTIRFGQFILSDLAFYVQAHFYPFSGSITGGTYLHPDSLRQYFGGEEDVYIEMDLLRQSWDFNSAASGMMFYNPFNSGIPIDGTPDTLDTSLDVPVRTWGLTTGTQGSVYTNTTFADTGWQSIGLYYRDDASGGQSDASYIDSDSGDTGDRRSYGDYGTLFENLSQRSVNLDLGFEAYFLPGNLGRDEALALTEIVEHPAAISTEFQNWVSAVEDDRAALPREFELKPNYPNPFNSETVIPLLLPVTGRVFACVLDSRGRLVATLFDGLLTAGRHVLRWQGRDASGSEVPSGLYLLQISSPAGRACMKMLYLK